MVGCTAVSEPIRVSWTISWSSDAQQGVTFETEPCSWRAAHAAGADAGVTADVLVRLSLTLGFGSCRNLTFAAGHPVGRDGHGRWSQQRSLGLDPVHASECAGRPRGL